MSFPIFIRKFSIRALWARNKPLIKQLFTFGIMGIITLIGNAIVFYALSPVLGTQLDNLVALILMTLVNSWLNKRFTFKDRTKEPLRKIIIVNSISFSIYWITTGVSLFIFEYFFATQAASTGGKELETFIVIISSCIGTLLKFVLFRVAYVPRTPNIKASIKLKSKVSASDSLENKTEGSSADNIS